MRLAAALALLIGLGASAPAHATTGLVWKVPEEGLRYFVVARVNYPLMLNFQAEINAELNYKIPIHVEGFGDLNIHFIHEPHAKKDAIPLLFVHGWPGSFLEALKIKRLLAESPSSAPDFHFVALSLPNFGFSDGVKKPGFGLSQYAEVCNKLMLSLGYNKYATQAGDGTGRRPSGSPGPRYSRRCQAAAPMRGQRVRSQPTMGTAASAAHQPRTAPASTSDRKWAFRTTRETPTPIAAPSQARRPRVPATGTREAATAKAVVAWPEGKPW